MLTYSVGASGFISVYRPKSTPAPLYGRTGRNPVKELLPILYRFFNSFIQTMHPDNVVIFLYGAEKNIFPDTQKLQDYVDILDHQGIQAWNLGQSIELIARFEMSYSSIQVCIRASRDRDTESAMNLTLFIQSEVHAPIAEIVKGMWKNASGKQVDSFFWQIHNEFQEVYELSWDWMRKYPNMQVTSHPLLIQKQLITTHLPSYFDISRVCSEMTDKNARDLLIESDFRKKESIFIPEFKEWKADYLAAWFWYWIGQKYLSDEMYRHWGIEVDFSLVADIRPPCLPSSNTKEESWYALSMAPVFPGSFFVRIARIFLFFFFSENTTYSYNQKQFFTAYRMKSIVAFDLETTGLDPKTDAIIEIALVRFDERGIIEEFSSLINPGIPIPEDITNITGITNADVTGAPFFSEIRDKIREFIGESSLLAHNADFDISFLREYGCSFDGRPVFDTFRLGEVFFWNERSLNLSHLAETLGYVHEWAHRALSDVKATIHVFREILKRITDASWVERDIFAFLGNIAPENGSFRSVMMECYGPLSGVEFSELTAKILANIAVCPPFEAGDSVLPEWEMSAKEVLSGSGFEERVEQMKMVELVTTSFEEGQHLLIEAPTGIGKTFAYGIPSILHAITKRERVHISTNTRTLQDQVMMKDIPKLREVFASLGLPDFRVAKLKGRTNYISILKFFEFLGNDEWSDESVAFAGKLAKFLLTTKTGELDEVSLYGRQFQMLEEVNASDPRVLAAENSYRKNEPLYIAREAAKNSDILLVNHALLLSELAEDAPGNLGKINRLVVDEAHNLEAVATDALKRVTTLTDIERQLGHIEASIRRYNKKPSVEKFLFPEIRSFVESIVLSSGMLFDFTMRYIEDRMAAMPERNGYGKGRTDDVLVASDFFSIEGVSGMRNVIGSLRERIKELSERLYSAPESLAGEFDQPLLQLEGFCVFFEEFYSATRDDLIKVISTRSGQAGQANAEVKLSLSPLDVSKVLMGRLWNRCSSVVLTSATLSVGDEFQYITKSLGLQGFIQHSLESDFDYSKQALMFIPTDLGDVRRDTNRNTANDFIGEVIRRVKGRTLCLFTSFASIRDTYLRINPAMKKEGILLLTQGMSGGKHKMVEEFKRNADHAALFGTDSFWEWVDLPGRTLETLIIHKFPFAVPTDPVVMARSKLYRDAFSEYSLPQMLLKLRQGMGRLIRTKEDRGIIILLDSRIHTAWGQKIFDSFPKSIRIRQGSSESFLQTLDAWKASRENDA